MPESLTFTTRLPNGTLDMWTPEVPASWAAGNAMGRDYAAELVAFMQATGNPSVFGAVMREITRKGVYEAVETGFTGYFGVVLAGVDATVKAIAVQPVRSAA